MSDTTKTDEADSKPDGSDETTQEPSGVREDPAPTIAVWILRIVTGVLLATLIGYLIHMIVREPVPVQFEIEPDWSDMRENGQGCALPIDVTNSSTQAVGQITLMAENEPDSESPETLSTTFALMGQGETVRAELVFDQCPTETGLELRVTSYQNP